jgi:hypothetical protein
MSPYVVVKILTRVVPGLGEPQAQHQPMSALGGDWPARFKK